MDTQANEKFEHYAIVELFGHLKIAGLVTEAVIGGCSLIRVDVPAVGEQPAYTRYFGQGAIYSLTPVSEEIARSALEYIRPRPVETYMLPAPPQAARVADPEQDFVDGELSDDHWDDDGDDDEIEF